ncbi:MAG: V-type ATP synthase subunit B [Synergistetes bacterium]|nr:V-type ATP synthase subunit B [Synergistota bacterium]MDW8191740.1 V-type ATP synthase subunit B [Synergistota bacterium]
MLEYVGVKRISGPLIFIESIPELLYGEIVEIFAPNGEERLGKVIELSEDFAVIQVFGETSGLSPLRTKIRLSGDTFKLGVSRGVIGRIFNGVGKPIDGGPEILAESYLDVNGYAINPVSRSYPREFVQTGISAIDVTMTITRGQKLPIFSGSGLPHNELAVQIARQAKIHDGEFAIVFAAMGIKNDVARFFIENFEKSGAIRNSVVFLNLANDPVIERLITPRCALTVAEYLAFDLDIHVLVILTDMTNYCEALRELSSRRGEIPGRKGYPGYMYSDLASIYERAGKIRGRNGSITQIPIVSMPEDDMAHPIPDLTGYITEGQIVLSRELYRKGIYPPINILPSLSRLMKSGIGKGKTREDHSHLSDQLYASYSHAVWVRNLASIVGEEELSSLERLYLRFADEFENKFIRQGFDEERSIEESLNLGWEVLTILPEEELHRVTSEEIESYYRRFKRS